MDKEKKKRLKEYKRNYRKRNKKGFSYSFGRIVRRARRWIRGQAEQQEGSRRALLAGAAALLLACSAGLAVWAVLRLLPGKEGEPEAALPVQTVENGGEENPQQSRPQEQPDMEPLLENAYPQVNELVNRYFAALTAGDVETLTALRDNTENKELLRMQENGSRIDSYNNISCYTKSGVEPDSYVVFAYYEVKFDGAETALPGITPLYVYKNEEGEYLLHDLEQKDEQADRAGAVAAQEDVVQLYARVSEEYQRRLQEDEGLAAYMEEYTHSMAAAVGEALEQQSMEPSSEAASEETKDVQNDSGGQDISAGESGADEDSSAGASYGTASQVPNSGMYTVTETINVRRSASETSEKLGTCFPGEQVEILMKQADGWTRVSYKGQTGYVKSDVLK